MHDVISFDVHERSVYQLCKDFLDALASLAFKLSVREAIRKKKLTKLRTFSKKTSKFETTVTSQLFTT